MEDYKLFYEDGKYYLKSLSLTYTLKAKLFKQNCNFSGWELLEEYSLNNKEEIELSLIDIGEYKIEIKIVDGFGTEFLNEEKSIKSYFSFIKEMVTDIKKVFCEGNKNCGNCLKNTDKCSMLSTALSQTTLLNNLYLPEISILKEKVTSIFNCTNINLLTCQINSNFIQGKYTSSESLVSALIAIDYITLFLYFKNNESEDLFPSLENAKILFNFDTIIKCIEKEIKMSFREIEDKI